MLRITNNFRSLDITRDILNSNPYFVNSQTVRWRKPRWIPQAKSKIFKVPPRLVQPEDERIELMRLNANYKTQIKSIERYFYQKYYIIDSSQTDPDEQNREFEEDYARCVDINNKWNEKQKILREKRVAEELEAELNFARENVQFEMKKEEEKMQMIEEIVRKEKNQSKSYIVPENIDAAIERALANPVDYNFAINLNGEKIIGFENEKKEQKARITQ